MTLCHSYFFFLLFRAAPSLSPVEACLSKSKSSMAHVSFVLSAAVRGN